MSLITSNGSLGSFHAGSGRSAVHHVQLFAIGEAAVQKQLGGSDRPLLDVLRILVQRGYARTMLADDDDFLGRGWVPLTLITVVSSAAGLVLIGWVGPAFLTAAALVALSITARLTWDKRRRPFYLPAIAGLIAVQVLAIITFGPHVQRGPGALFMLGALAEAIIMIAVLRFAL